MKKILSAILAIAIVASLGVVSFAAGADNTNTAAAIAADGFDIEKIVKSDNSTPMATTDTVVPGTTYYAKLGDLDFTGADAVTALDGTTTVDFSAKGTEILGLIANVNDFKFKYKKTDGAQAVKSVKIVEKSINNDRGPWVAIELKEEYTDKEVKVGVDLTFTLKGTKAHEITADTLYLSANAAITSTVAFWATNDTIGADADVAAGKGNAMLKPNANDSNELVWNNNNYDIAKLTFEADNDPSKIYSKLKTEWVNDIYADQIGSADAFKLTWVSAPKISSTSRAVLTIYNPFYDRQEDVTTVDQEEINVYKDVDGELVLVNDQFQWVEDDNGDTVLVTKVRDLTNYVITDGKTITDGATTEEPAGDKENPGTGR